MFMPVNNHPVTPTQMISNAFLFSRIVHITYLYLLFLFMLFFLILEILAELELTCLPPPDMFVHPFLLLSDILKERNFFPVFFDQGHPGLTCFQLLLTV